MLSKSNGMYSTLFIVKVNLDSQLLSLLVLSTQCFYHVAFYCWMDSIEPYSHSSVSVLSTPSSAWEIYTLSIMLLAHTAFYIFVMKVMDILNFG